MNGELKGDKDMIEQVWYIADDGTTFKDGDECSKYEFDLVLKKHEHDIHMWDDNFQPISITDPQALDKVYYLTCDTVDAVETMNDWFESIGYPSPFGGDESFAAMIGRHYYYQDDNDNWYEADKLMEKAQKMIKIFGV